MKGLRPFSYFTVSDAALWGASVLLIFLSFFFFDRSTPFTPLISTLGVTSLIFIAKGNPIGQVLMILFSLFYGAISFSYAYYGEMATYLGMTLPMALVALVTWMKNPYHGNRSEVKVNRIGSGEVVLMLILAAVVTVVFFFILRYFSTANLIPSTLSVSTSFIAAYLTLRRSPYYALVYAMNDLVLILLWSLASLENISYLSVVICFIAFLANDLYGFVCWLRRMKKQEAESNR